MWADRMLWGSTLRSPHPRARIREIDIGPALRVPGVHAVLTHEDVPGRKTYGLEIPDQPVLAWEDVRYQGEAIAIVAADHPETARAAAAQDRRRLRGARGADRPREARSTRRTPPLHPTGNLLRHVPIRHGDPDAEGEVVVTGEYEVGMQDQAFLGPGVGPRGAGRGRRRRPLHRHPVAARGPRPARRLARPAAGEGAARARRRRRRVRRPRGPLDAGPRLPARAPHRPPGEDDVRARGVVLRPHPPPPGADALRAPRHARRASSSRCGRGSCSTAAPTRRARPRCARTPPRSRAGPTTCRTRAIDAYVVYTDNPPCGAMRGFGAVQTCFAHEAQMDKLAAALEMDPVELRRRNAMATGSTLPTGAQVRCPAPVEELLARVVAMPRARRTTGGLPGRRRQRHPRRGRRARRRLRGRLQEHRLLRGLRRLLDRARAAVAGGRRAARRGPHRRRRGRPGPRHRAGADRAPRAGRRPRRRAARRHPGRHGGLVVGLAPDDDDRRRGQGRLRGGDGGAARPRRAARGCSRTARSRRPASTTTARPSRSTRTARATRTSRSRSPPTAPWSTSTPSSGSCAWSRSPPRRTSARRSTRRPSRGRSRAASPRGSGWR